MKTLRLIAALAAPLLLAQPAAAADNYPSKPVKIIVPYQAGQGTDVAARYLAEGRSIILAAAEGELGLQEQLVPGHQPVADRRLNRLADGRLEVVLALVGGVDAAEPLPQREGGEPLGLVLLPRGPVQEPGNRYPVDGERAVGR